MPRKSIKNDLVRLEPQQPAPVPVPAQAEPPVQKPKMTKEQKQVTIPVMSQHETKLLSILRKNDIDPDALTNRVIFDRITKKYTNIGTRTTFFYALMTYFIIKHWTGNLQETRKIKQVSEWVENARNSQKEVDALEKQNKKTNKELENWKSYEDICKIRDSIKVEKDDIPAANEKLLLQMTTMQPPLRNDFYASVEFIQFPDWINHEDKTKNYLVLRTFRKVKSAFYVVNDDKVSNRAAYYNDDNFRIIDIESKELIKILHDSYDKRQRKNVFENSLNQAYSNDTIYDLLLHRKYNLNFDILRSAYVTWYHKNNPTYGDREKLAQKMRHSLDIALKNYAKVEDKQEEKPQISEQIHNAYITKMVQYERENTHLKELLIKLYDIYKKEYRQNISNVDVKNNQKYIDEVISEVQKLNQ